MKISLSPFRPVPGAEFPTITRAGDVLTINGDVVDLSVIPDGATLPSGAISNDWIVDPVERIDGDIHITLRLPHGADPSHAVAFPAPIIDPPDGLLALPRDPEPQEPDHGDD